jgi:hypothetical protein
MSGLSGDNYAEVDLFEKIRDRRSNKNNLFKPTKSSSVVEGRNKNSIIEEDDDKKSVASSFYPLMNAEEPEIPEIEREQRIATWYEIAYGPNYTQDRVEQEEDALIALKNQPLTTAHENMTWSEKMLNMQRDAFVPYHATRTHYTRMCSELAFPLHVKSLEYRPTAPLECFGSKTEWAQGNVIDRLDKKGGVLSNCYVLRGRTSYIKHELPCSIGVLFGEVHPDGNKTKFIPFNGAIDYCEKSFNDHPDIDDGFHLILPPYYESAKEEIAYRSTADVNSEYGKKYVSLTSKIEDITRGVKPIGSDWLVPSGSPILQKIFCESRCSQKELPYLDKNGDPEGIKYYVVNRTLFQQTVLGIQRQVMSSIPVHDLEKFAVRFYPLWNAPYSKLLTARAVAERNTAISSFTGAKTVSTKTMSDNYEKSFADYGLYFKFEIDIMYRDVAECALEKTSD